MPAGLPNSPPPFKKLSTGIKILSGLRPLILPAGLLLLHLSTSCCFLLLLLPASYSSGMPSQEQEGGECLRRMLAVAVSG